MTLNELTDSMVVKNIALLIRIMDCGMTEEEMIMKESGEQMVMYGRRFMNCHLQEAAKKQPGMD